MNDAKVQHLIVLMMENRAFDHLVGYLTYPAGTAFDGLNGKEQTLGNPLPGGKVIYPSRDASYFLEIGPNHTHDSVMRQLLGQNPRAYPYQLTNNGFVEDYETVNPGHGAEVLQCFTPDKLPMLSALAQEFALCDRWFCSVPGATWPNRNYAHAATSDGEVDIVSRSYLNPTVYEQLSAAKRDWAIYYGGFPAQAMAFTRLWDTPDNNWLQRFKPLARLYRAIQHDKLPHYAFVEPDMLGRYTNSQHPGMGGEINFRAGEHLIWQIYETLRQNPSVFQKTLLLVLYDEHGGFFDHVPPPQGPQYALEQVYRDPKTGYTFNFDLLGLRVPAVLVSPWIPRGTVDHTEYEHASIPATARKVARAAAPPLTARDARANTFATIASLDVPRVDLPELPEPQVDESARIPHPRVELEDSLAYILRDLLWAQLAIHPEKHSQVMARRSNLHMLGSVILPSALHETFMAKIAPHLSADARAVMERMRPSTGPQPAEKPSAETLVVHPELAAFELFLNNTHERVVRLLEDQALVDDAMRFADLTLRAFVERHNTVLRTVDGLSLENPDSAALEQALTGLYSNPTPGAARWLTIYADGRATFDDVQQSYTAEGVGPVEALALLTALQQGNIRAVIGKMR